MAALTGSEVIVDDPKDRRRWPRVAERNRISLVVTSSPNAPTVEGRRYYCWTEDVSYGGIRFCVHSHVPLGSVMKMDVDTADSGYGSFLHVGRVVWEQEFEDGGLVSRWLGVEITETLGGQERTQLWGEMIRQLAALPDASM